MYVAASKLPIALSSAPSDVCATACGVAVQLVSLKRIAEFTLLQTPSYKSLQELPLIRPGELLEQHLHFEKPVVLYVSPNNPGLATPVPVSPDLETDCLTFGLPQVHWRSLRTW